MAEHARVCWFSSSQPWPVEADIIAQADLPLNLDQNRHHPFSAHRRKIAANSAGR